MGKRAYEIQRRYSGVRSSVADYQGAYLLAGLIFTTVGLLVLFGAITLGG